jgi:hypothetical protein
VAEGNHMEISEGNYDRSMIRQISLLNLQENLCIILTFNSCKLTHRYLIENGEEIDRIQVGHRMATYDNMLRPFVKEAILAKNFAKLEIQSFLLKPVNLTLITHHT